MDDGVTVEDVAFPASLQALGSPAHFTLGGAGFRALQIDGQLVKFTCHGVYLEQGLLQYLALKYKGMSSAEVYEEEAFFQDIVTSPYEKFIRMEFLQALPGEVFCEKVLEVIDEQKLYNGIQAKYKQQWMDAFKGECFPSGSSILFFVSADGFKVGFGKDKCIPEKPTVVIEDPSLGEAFIASVICKDGVSPTARLSLAERISKLL